MIPVDKFPGSDAVRFIEAISTEHNFANLHAICHMPSEREGQPASQPTKENKKKELH